VLQWKRQKGRKGSFSNDLGGFIDAMRGRQFPLSLQIAGHQITVVIDCCVNGVPNYIGPIGKVVADEPNPTIKFGSGFLDVERVGVAHQSDLDVTKFVGEENAQQCDRNS
jgi:hypothetical protein